MNIRNCVVVFLVMLTSASLTAGSVQKWVDENGNVHYGDKPPTGIQSKQIEVAPAPAASGLRPEEARQLRRIESRETNSRSRRDYESDRDTYYKERQKRDDNLFRCRELDRRYSSGRYRKGEIVAQQRRLGCR